MNPAPPDLRPRPGLWSQLVTGLVVFAGYSFVAGWIPFQSRALGNAKALLAVETFLHIDVEHTMNDWLAAQSWLRVVANYEYAYGYILTAFATLIWVYFRRVPIYRVARNSFVLMNVLGIVCFAVFPVTPPRLLPDVYGYHDTVRLGGTVGSWGSSLVSHANDLAAMPSLHVAWALWVTVVLSRLSSKKRWLGLSVLHVLVTVLVILATGNHYLVDAAGAAVVTVAAFALADVHDHRRRRRGDRVPAADAFFWHVEDPQWPQVVGGIALLDTREAETERAEIERLVRAELPGLPRFRQRVRPGTGWWRPSWVAVDETDIDFAWHIPEHDLQHAGMAAAERFVAELAATPLPTDRPLWRIVLIHRIAPGVSGVVFLMHHAVSDGFGTIAQALRIMRPALPAPRADITAPGPLTVAAATAVGLAQLALARAPRGRPVSGGSGRTYVMLELDFAEIRALAAARGVRVTDVVLTLVGGAVARLGTNPQEEMRTSVPIMVRDPRDAEVGNVTATVMLDVPVGPGDDLDRLAAVAARSAVLRSGTRALAARWVMGPVSDVLPAAVHRRFARLVYGRRFFHAIMSNLPGPDMLLSLAGTTMPAAFPVLPLAPGAPIAVGALRWHTGLCVGFVADPALAPDGETLRAALLATLDTLRAERRSVGADGDLQPTS